MISSADDFLIHQTHEPVRHAYTSDRRFYDRYFFTGHACNADLFFMIGMGCYPNLGVIACRLPMSALLGLKSLQGYVD
jgi:hypothetical protein